MTDSKRVIRIGFLGAGNWGVTRHIPAIEYVKRHYSNEFTVSIQAICEKNASIAADISEKYKIPRVHNDLLEFAKDKEIDCYVIVVKPKNLRSILEILCKKNLPILTEKPPGLTYEDAKYLANHVKNINLVGFNRRYFPIVSQFKSLIDSFSKEIYYIDSNFYRYERYDSVHQRTAPFVTGTGVHGINLLEYLFGQIRNCSTTKLHVHANDTMAWLADLDFTNEIKGRIKILPCCGSLTEWVEAHSQHYSFYLQCGLYGEIDNPGKITVHKKGKLADVITAASNQSWLVQQGLVEEYLEFFAAITKDAPIRSTLATSVNSMRIAELIENA